MTNIAVLITVFNRREITLQGLHALKKAIDFLGDEYHFDIYLTDDGCTDGTADSVRKEFPQVKIIRGNGNLFWGGGMNLAWKIAADAQTGYDYYLWYNDDSVIFHDALQTLFNTVGNETIVTGAFMDHAGNVSYGGKTQDEQLISPNNQPQEVELMNGNLVLIPNGIFQNIGLIDKHYIHGGGDFDYSYRARERGYRVLLTPKYVGIADRHDAFIPKYCDRKYNLAERWKILHNPANSPIIHFRYNLKRGGGIIKAIAYLFIAYIGTLFPFLYVKVKQISKVK